MNGHRNYNLLRAEINELRLQLDEANETIEAIRTGQIDALVVHNEDGHQLYTLKSADHTYRVLIEKMKEGAVTLNKEGLILYSNSQFADMVNLPLPRVIGLQFSKFIPRNYTSEYKKLVEKAWESDCKGEIFLKNKNNNLIPFLLSFTTLELDEGTALSIILTDLSLQKETEKKLKKQNEELIAARQRAAKTNEELEEMVRERTKDLLISREHFKFLADNIPVIVWTARPDGTVDYFNKRWQEYTGLSLSESIGSGWHDVLHHEDLESMLQSWKEAFESGNHFEFEYRIRRAADGIYRWHYGHAVPFRDVFGNLVTWFGTSTDIEDRKKEMEKKDEFIGVASHELKTPLTSLKGYIQLMDCFGDELPLQITQYVKKANESINKLQYLINDLLDVSKIQSGKLEFTLNSLNLSELIDDCLESCRYMFPEYDFQKEIERDMYVEGNADRLEQVVMNLVGNAVKYSPGNKTILIRAISRNNEVYVSVKDFGIGLQEEDKKLIFDRFYRVNSSKHISGGLGMGLYISSEIIKAHKGKIEVDSQIDHGATFTFSLPFAKKIAG
jgi:two-component system CheB/CheR fusion protein